MNASAIAKDVHSWVVASRPLTLTAAAMPVLIGTALAAQRQGIDWLLFALSFIGAVLIQVVTNLADEYTDHRKVGAAKFPAPHKVIQRGLLSERAVLMGAVACFVLVTCMGLYIVSQVGWPILAVGILSLMAGYLHSSGPFPLGHWALGELTVFLFMGPLIVMASYYVQTQEITWPVFWASVPIGLLVTAILQCNNLRDLQEDRAAGKHTWATLFGLTAGRWTYAALVLGAYAAMIAMAIAGMAPWPSLLALASLPWALRRVRRLWSAGTRPAFNEALAGAARLHLAFGVLMAVGMAVQAAV